MAGPAGAGGSDTRGCQGGGQGVVNMTALDGLGNAGATGLLVNLWTAPTTPAPTMQCSVSAGAKFDTTEERSHQVTRYM